MRRVQNRKRGLGCIDGPTVEAEMWLKNNTMYNGENVHEWIVDLFGLLGYMEGWGYGGRDERGRG